MRIQLRGVSKTFRVASAAFNALSDIDLDLASGSLVALVGRSGSGKSTLLSLIAGLDRPTTGEVLLGDTRIDPLPEARLARFRGQHVGVVFQFFQLLPTLTIRENVRVAMDLVGRIPRNDRSDRVVALLEQVGIADQADKLPATLSGGQQQRAAIARALANDPPVLVADEPTGNLDSATAAAVMGLFFSLRDQGRTVVLVTHDLDGVGVPDRIVELHDGRTA